MGYRSNAWVSQKQKLADREEILREELEDASNEFESKVKLFVITAVIGGLGAFLAYKAYKKFTNDKEPEAPAPAKSKKAESTPKVEKVEKVDVAREAADYGVKRMLVEKLSLAAINLLSSQVDKMIASKNERAAKKEQNAD